MLHLICGTTRSIKASHAGCAGINYSWVSCGSPASTRKGPCVTLCACRWRLFSSSHILDDFLYVNEPIEMHGCLGCDHRKACHPAWNGPTYELHAKWVRKITAIVVQELV